ncbi:DUF1993 domain-containing protein [Caulobacter sp. KR2-114]|uniref:DUF1993 domain-containing protein n=1 Tax=Caulobacter sp. KR2-114 TaxID=3400912 RepID=UPI003C02E684
MAVSLYDVSVGSYLQTLGAVQGFLQRGLDHCVDNNIDPQEIVGTRLCGDMLPFAFQIVSVKHHSLGAIEGVKAGAFGPPGMGLPGTYEELQALVTSAIDGLKALSRDEVEALADKDVTFAIGDFKLPFTGSGFILSFSLPNFYFHAATAYDILRHKGVPLGKRDFMGQMRMKAPA